MSTEGHREANRKYRLKVEAERKANGTCLKCGLPRGEFQFCDLCRAKREAYRKRKEQRYIASGKCKLCQSPLDGVAYSKCANCRKTYSTHNKNKVTKRITEGRCNQCGGDRDRTDRLSCKKCRDFHKEVVARRWERAKADGKCVYCPELAVVTGGKRNVCMRCWFRGIAGQTLGDIKKWVVLKELWDEQDGLCKYTGIGLVPGPTSSIDHKLPSSKGGGDEKDNLQWVLFSINCMKRNLTHEQFIEFCRTISSRFPESH